MIDPLRATVTAALAGDPARPATKDAVLSANQLVWVKRSVKIMSVMLVAGLALLVGRIVYLVRRTPPQAATAAFSAPSNEPPLADIALPLPAGAHVRTMSVAGNRLAVHYSLDAGGEAIAIVDLTTGRVVSHVQITAEKAGKSP